MDYRKAYTRSIILTTITGMLFVGVAALLLWLLLGEIFSDSQSLHVISWIGGLVVIALLGSLVLVHDIKKPFLILADLITYLGHNSRGGVPPDPYSLRIGREMVVSLAQLLTDMSGRDMKKPHPDTAQLDENATTTPQPTPKLLEVVGMPVIGIDREQRITHINRLACDYLGTTQDKAIGAMLYDCAHFAFQSDETFESWFKNALDNNAVASRTWERVRIVDSNNTPLKQFDLVAGFSNHAASGTDTILAIYDKTSQYGNDDSEISYVALAVHELRTPLTIMRGYIEAFQDELEPTLDEEMKGFLHKMQASAEQLTAFVANILNVARVEENQLMLNLQKHSWQEVVSRAVEDLRLRAAVHGKNIDVQLANDIPPVAVDRISIHEVINNLVDNAIKYSGSADTIRIVSALNSDGMVETRVQDFGIGVPATVMPDLFQKFYRSHKSRVQIGGTGLGLYLCKAITTAHGGNIWVRSKEGQGSVFSFTIQPFDHMKHEPGDEDGIMRGAHGWIKNHSLNRQ